MTRGTRVYLSLIYVCTQQTGWPPYHKGNCKKDESVDRKKWSTCGDYILREGIFIKKIYLNKVSVPAFLS